MKMTMVKILRTAAVAVVLLGTAGILRADSIPAQVINWLGTTSEAADARSDSNETRHSLKVFGLRRHGEERRAQHEALDVTAKDADELSARTRHSRVFKAADDSQGSSSNEAGDSTSGASAPGAFGVAFGTMSGVMLEGNPQSAATPTADDDPSDSSPSDPPVSSTPEPSTVSALGIGLLGFLLIQALRQRGPGWTV